MQFMLVYQVGPRYAGAQAEGAESSQNNWNVQKKDLPCKQQHQKQQIELSVIF